MYELIQNLLSDKDTGNFTFAPFSLCHIIYLLIISFIIFITIVLFKKRSEEEKIKLINFTLILAVIVYIADFFLRKKKNNVVCFGCFIQSIKTDFPGNIKMHYHVGENNKSPKGNYR